MTSRNSADRRRRRDRGSPCPSGREPTASTAASPGKNGAPAGGAHACPKTVLPLPPAPVGLKGALHEKKCSKSLNPVGFTVLATRAIHCCWERARLPPVPFPVKAGRRPWQGGLLHPLLPLGVFPLPGRPRKPSGRFPGTACSRDRADRSETGGRETGPPRRKPRKNRDKPSRKGKRGSRDV